MKAKLLFTFALALAVMTVNAAPKQPKTNGNKAIDKLKYTISYSVKSVRDTLKVDSLGKYTYETDDMRLEVGEKVSYFYSQTRKAYGEAVALNIKLGTTDSSKLPSSNMEMLFYRNYPEGKTTYCEETLGDPFRIVEPLEIPTWEMVADSTKRILDYDCQMARCAFKGRVWTAWFAPDVPLDNGPWKLNGLPGLVLRAYDSRMQFVFDCVGMKQEDGTKDICYDTSLDTYSSATMKEFVEYQAKAVPADIFADKGVVIEVPEEMKAQLKAAMAKPQPYNPLELFKKK